MFASQLADRRLAALWPEAWMIRKWVPKKLAMWVWLGLGILIGFLTTHYG